MCLIPKRTTKTAAAVIETTTINTHIVYEKDETFQNVFRNLNLIQSDNIPSNAFKESTELSDGYIYSIVAATSFFFALLVFCLRFCLKRRKRLQAAMKEYNNTPNVNTLFWKPKFQQLVVNSEDLSHMRTENENQTKTVQSAALVEIHPDRAHINRMPTIEELSPTPSFNLLHDTIAVGFDQTIHCKNLGGNYYM